MKEIRRREIELLAKVCHRHDVSTKLVKELIRSAEKFSYENVTQKARISEYDSLIKHLINKPK
ncbi:DNA modification system-associated small protein [Bacillus sp. N9]